MNDNIKYISGVFFSIVEESIVEDIHSNKQILYGFQVFSYYWKQTDRSSTKLKIPPHIKYKHFEICYE